MSEVSSKIVLGIGIAILAGMAYMTFSAISRNAAESGRGYALPELREHLSEVRGLTLTAAENRDVLTLKRDPAGWTIKEKGGYPADAAAVTALLQKLADARLLEARTAVEQRYAELGVEDVRGKEARGVKLTLDGLATPVRLIIGNTDAEADRTYVRRAEERKAWAAQGNLQINRDPAAWLDRKLADIAPERLAEIAVSRPGAKPMRLTRTKPEDSAFRLAEGGKGKTVEGGALASALSGLTLLDVAAAAPAPADAMTARYRTFDGLMLDVQIWEENGACRMRLSAVLDPKQSEAQIKTVQARLKRESEAGSKPAGQTPETPLAVTDPAKDLQQRLQEAEAGAQKLQQRFAERQFTVPAESCARFQPPAALPAEPAEAASPPAAQRATRKKR